MNSESKQIQVLRERYRDSLPEKSALITQHIQTLLDTNIDDLSEVFEEIRQDIHKLAGSLGMYGYSELAVIARRAMSIIDGDDKSGLEHELLNFRNLLIEQTKS